MLLAPRPQSAQKGPGRDRLRGRPGIAKGPRVSPGASSLGSADGAVHRSAAPCPPTDFLRSTLGARGLSFRVRNGTGRAPPALAADRWAAPPALGLGPPRALRAAQRAEDTETLSRSAAPALRALGPGRVERRVRARAISAARLRRSPALHLRPIDQVVYLGPYRKGN